MSNVVREALEHLECMCCLQLPKAKCRRCEAISALDAERAEHAKEVADLRKRIESDLADVNNLLLAKDELVMQVVDLQQRISELEAQLETIRNATCLTCGRSLAPDGDCYGCEVDRLAEIVKKGE